MTLREIKLTLPVPPSVNQAYANVARVGRVKTKRYKAWQREAGYIALSQCMKRPALEKCSVHYAFYFRDARRRDAANFEKCLSDFLVHMGYLKDDSGILINMQTKAGIDAARPRVEIIITEIL